MYLMKMTEKSIKNILTSKGNSFQEFFLRSRLNILLCIEIGSRSENNLITFEELCELIPKSIASRSSILFSLREGVGRNFLVKSKSNLDGRQRLYSLSSDVHEVYAQIMDGVDQEEGYEKEV